MISYINFGSLPPLSASDGFGAGADLPLRTIVELLDKRITRERRLFEVVRELKRVLGTRRDTKHAKRATAKIVHILVELALLFRPANQPSL